ncbi:unnamed protein product [Haemonchus placei]|uniref:Uncharacterized protein n=1 Tax=Haemonchus placei TaxID=6290 RepID=A0A3P7UWU0_HAEPC|nr:unnamed protein product [Haemonchus placei]
MCLIFTTIKAGEPIAVLFDQGCTTQFWINVILTFLVWIPGVIHAFWVILIFMNIYVAYTSL